MEKIYIAVLALSTLLGNAFTSTVTYTKEYVETPIAQAEGLCQEIQAPEAPIRPVAQGYCSCVAYVRTLIPSLPRGDAKDLETNSIFPVKNSAVKLSYGDNYQVDKYHLAFVREVTQTHIKIVSDCKHGKHEIIYEDIPLDSDLIQGYWRPVK